MTRSAVILAIALLPLTAWSCAQAVPDATGGGVLHVEEQPISIDVPSSAFPPPGDPAAFYVTAQEPSTVVAGLPTPGVWVLEVALQSPLRITQSLQTIARTSVEYRVSPLEGSTVSGCIPTTSAVDRSWAPVGAGSRVAVLQGPGVCRLKVWVRLRMDGHEEAGAYRGSLSWSLRHESP